MKTKQSVNESIIMFNFNGKILRHYFQIQAADIKFKIQVAGTKYEYNP